VARKQRSQHQQPLPQPPQPNWFKKWFHDSETILVARLQTAVGAIISLVGIFDWSPIWDTFKTGTAFTKQQLILIGIGVVGSGLTVELARRRPGSSDPV
jgi:hypothetical protein